MPTISISKTYADNTVLNEADLDASFDSIETFLNVTKLDSSNIQANGIATSNIADSAITTPKIADANVTKPKLAALGQQISSTSSSGNIGSTTLVDVASLSISITTTGRPVFIGLIHSGGTNSGQVNLFNGGGAASAICDIAFLRDATIVSKQRLYFEPTAAATHAIPCSSFWHVDTPSAGTYTYKVQARVEGAPDVVTLPDVKLIAFEL